MRTWAEGCVFADIRSSVNSRPANCVLSIYQHGGGDERIKSYDVVLHPNERNYLGSNISQRRETEYRAGRLAAKHALSVLLNEPNPASIEIARGVFNQPIVKHASVNVPEISISHKRAVAVALAFDAGYCMGVDIEEHCERSTHVIQSQLTAAERRSVKEGALDYKSACSQLWSVKEALSKVLKTGLTARLEIYEATDLEFDRGVLSKCFFSNFYQYRAKTWIVEKYVLAIVFPRNATLELDAEQLCAHLENRI